MDLLSESSEWLIEVRCGRDAFSTITASILIIRSILLLFFFCFFCIFFASVFVFVFVSFWFARL